jgi:hypothetical protein
MLAVSQVPLLPVLAAKNNAITLLTGISHEKVRFSIGYLQPSSRLRSKTYFTGP